MTCTCSCSGHPLLLFSLAISTDARPWRGSTWIMLTACQIGLSCHSQYFYFYRSRSLGSGFYQPLERRGKVGGLWKRGIGCFALVKVWCCNNWILNRFQSDFQVRLSACVSCVHLRERELWVWFVPSWLQRTELVHSAWSPLDIFTQRLEQFPPGDVCPAEGWCASSCTDVHDWPDEWSWVLWLAEADGTLAGLHGRALCGHATCGGAANHQPPLVSVMTNYSSLMLHAERQARDRYSDPKRVTWKCQNYEYEVL